jgi:phosphohistidine phosphatase
MRLVMLRHGPAGTRDPLRWPDDRKRPLTEKGLARTRRACMGLMQLEPAISLVLTSPLLRSVQTTHCLRELLPEDAVVQVHEALAPGGSWRDTLAAVESVRGDATVVLVGHEPDLGKLVGVMLFGAPASLPLRKAGACGIEFSTPPAPGKGRLRWFLTPRALRRFARGKHVA